MAGQQQMLCPICKKQLSQIQDNLLRCSNYHGTLITNKFLQEIEESAHIETKGEAGLGNTPHEIICPHCQMSMHKVDYNGTGIIIDACSSCHYRWMDEGEIEKIKNFVPEHTAEGLLFILDIDQRIKKAESHEIKEANPRLPLQGSWRAGSEAIGGFSDNQTAARSGAIVGQGLYGLIKGLTHSRTSRRLTLVTLIIFAILFAVVFIDSKSLPGI